MIKPTKGMTAGEVVARLEQDINYVAEKQKFDAKRQQQIQQSMCALDPVLQELNQVGFDVSSLDELRRSGIVYKAAVPILLKWLPLVADIDAKESVVRALSVPWAKSIAGPALIAEFLKASNKDTGLKWAIGNALEVVVNESIFDQLCELARDPRHDTARQMIILALGKLKNPKAIPLLIDLLEQDGVSGHALKALAKFQTEMARPHFERFLKDTRTWVRKEAARALTKLDKLKPLRE